MKFSTILKCGFHWIAAEFWNKVSDVFIVTGDIARKHNNASGMLRSAMLGRAAVQKTLLHVNEFKKLFGMK